MFNDTGTTEIYTLSLHDALPILIECRNVRRHCEMGERALAHREIAIRFRCLTDGFEHDAQRLDRKSTRLNSSHVEISYAVFCLKNMTIADRMLSTHLR